MSVPEIEICAALCAVRDCDAVCVEDVIRVALKAALDVRNRAKQVPLTASLLRELLSYDPETGVLRWRVKIARSTVIGSVAGTTIAGGYCLIRMLGKQAFYAHRLAYLYMVGEWPPEQIDHIDRDPSNNRWNNLRISNQTQNMGNARKPDHNTSGIKGVSFDKRRQKWRAYIVVARKQRALGYFEHKHDAATAYARAATETFGEFARTA